MCNEAARLRSLGEIVEAFSMLKIPLSFPEGLPNLPATDSIRITDPAAIVRLRDSAHQLVQRRWSWVAGPAGGAGDRKGGGSSAGGKAGAGKGGGRPVYNYRSEGRRFGNAADGSHGRCLIPLDGFYEFTDPAPGAKRKTKWLFTMRDGAEERGLFCVAGLWRAVGESVGGGGVGDGAPPAATEAWTMLTCEPGPDIAPYHSRQIVLMPRDRWADWLGGVVPAADLIAPTPAGTLTVAQVG
ncbi:SOS response-associated peptidase family protein [Polymorphobacter megasporae]|nr:SOS response-associated peptidase family protein [Polymorphobacter megasporae]